jgi:hypothetical protein
LLDIWSCNHRICRSAINLGRVRACYRFGHNRNFLGIARRIHCWAEALASRYYDMTVDF